MVPAGESRAEWADACTADDINEMMQGYEPEETCL